MFNSFYKILKQWIDTLKTMNTSSFQCHRCGSCKHLCSYMKTTAQGDRNVQIS